MTRARAHRRRYQRNAASTQRVPVPRTFSALAVRAMEAAETLREALVDLPSQNAPAAPRPDAPEPAAEGRGP